MQMISRLSATVTTTRSSVLISHGGAWNLPASSGRPPTFISFAANASFSSQQATAMQAPTVRRAASPAQVLEERIERVIYHFRFMTLLGVLGSLIGSILCFLKGCVYVIDSFVIYFAGGKVIATLIEAIDIYLIGTVMLVFGMGLYELFISNMDMAKQSSHGSSLLGLFQLPERPKWLEIQSVNELKTKLGHVIVMVLLIGLFDKSKKVVICSSTDLLCFAASVLLSSCGLYLLSKLQYSKKNQVNTP